MQDNKCLILYNGKFGDSFTLNGKIYCLNSFIKIGGVEYPVAVVPVDRV